MIQRYKHGSDSHQMEENRSSSFFLMGILRKLARRILSVYLFCFLLIYYLPLYIIMHTGLRVKIAKLKIYRYFGIVEKSELAQFSRKHNVSDISKTSTDEKLDFMQNRRFVYYWRFTFWTCYEITKMFAGLQTIPLISDSQLIYVIMNSVCAHSVSWCEEKSMFLFHMKGFESLTLFKGFFFDARKVYIKEDYSKIIIVMYNGKEFHSDCEHDLDNYKQAKLHLQICMTYYVPGLAHNHVHFVLPSTICVKSKQVLNKKGYLYKLLSPHFRFTEAINYQAIRIGKATNNKRSIIDRLFVQWQAFPVTMEQFVIGIAEKCESYYCKLEEEDQFAQKKTKDEHLTSNEICEVLSDDSLKEKKVVKPKKRCHDIFPPKFVTNKKISQIPYMKFLRGYYFVVRSFIEEIQHFIDLSEHLLHWRNITANLPTNYRPLRNR